MEISQPHSADDSGSDSVRSTEGSLPMVFFLSRVEHVDWRFPSVPSQTRTTRRQRLFGFSDEDYDNNRLQRVRRSCFRPPFATRGGLCLVWSRTARVRSTIHNTRITTRSFPLCHAGGSFSASVPCLLMSRRFVVGLRREQPVGVRIASFLLLPLFRYDLSMGRRVSLPRTASCGIRLIIA